MADGVALQDPDGGATTAYIAQTSLTTKCADGFESRPYLNPVLMDLLAIPPSIPLSTESKSVAGREPSVIA